VAVAVAMAVAVAVVIEVVCYDGLCGKNAIWEQTAD
jgi:hypothetical protein